MLEVRVTGLDQVDVRRAGVRDSGVKADNELDVVLCVELEDKLHPHPGQDYADADPLGLQAAAVN